MYCLAGLMIAGDGDPRVAFLRSDFSYDLVAERYSSTDTPTFYKVTAMWATQEGSLLLWVLLLSLYSSVVLFATRRSPPRDRAVRERGAGRDRRASSSG